MSVPRKNTVWGKFLFKGKEFDVLNGRHLNKTIENTINAFMKKRKPLLYFPFSPWLNMQPQWKLENGKLYLTDICLYPDVNTQTEYRTENQDNESFGTIKKQNIKINKRELMLCDDKQSTIHKIFGVDKIFAEWINEPMKLLIKESRQKSIVINQGKEDEKVRYQVTMDLLVMVFKQGVLVSQEEKQETYFTVKNYLESL